MNKKWWFGVLMLSILVVGLSIASVNAEGGSYEVVTQEESGGYEVVTQEEAYESLRQHGASEEVIESLRELNRRLDQLRMDGASDEEAGAIIEEFSLRIQQIQQHEQGTKSSGDS